jgi:hypothetical protein
MSGSFSITINQDGTPIIFHNESYIQSTDIFAVLSVNINACSQPSDCISYDVNVRVKLPSGR